METFDTNVVVRILVRDDPRQNVEAERSWEKALAEDGVFLPTIVLVETVWVLRSAYHFDRKAIASSLQFLLDVEGVEVERSTLVRRAIERFQAGSADLADYMILEQAIETKNLPVRTFDRRFAREQEVLPLG